jgi:hypothetical protein
MYNPKEKAKQIIEDISDIISATSIIIDESLLKKAIFNHSLLILTELRQQVEIGYDYDKDFFIPFYHAVEKEIENLIYNKNEKYISN